MRALNPHAQPWTGERTSPAVQPPSEPQRMGMESLKADGQASIMGLVAVRWVPVTTATQVPLWRIDADGVRCGLPAALGSG
jgi:hypothetical protein